LRRIFLADFPIALTPPGLSALPPRLGRRCGPDRSPGPARGIHAGRSGSNRSRRRLRRRHQPGCIAACCGAQDCVIALVWFDFQRCHHILSWPFLLLNNVHKRYHSVAVINVQGG
jgi:hypothetical protein